MKLPSFKLIVNSKNYTALVRVSADSKTPQQWHWENTNKLLEKGWAGIKTGVTDSAGPCLATCIKLRDPVSQVCRNLIIVILHAQTMEIRWEECQKLAAWVVENTSSDTWSSNYKYFPVFLQLKLYILVLISSSQSLQLSCMFIITRILSVKYIYL